LTNEVERLREEAKQRRVGEGSSRETQRLVVVIIGIFVAGGSYFAGDWANRTSARIEAHDETIITVRERLTSVEERLKSVQDAAVLTRHDTLEMRRLLEGAALGQQFNKERR
jgi:hypothetical protein